ncbi:serine/threonine protein kinase [Kibdelosporangium banguiense]|uniref:Serine/threonine protein kinase n=1 Tax=Kibdelosporangium banguiense TaxID=1365924 RepID=A0ABS4TG64_9PSEU|nr:serine/threonine protein kinase [Kibdelosporangium banguiense]
MSSDADSFDHVWRPLPMGWECARRDIWVTMSCRGRTLPRQGWKVHVSARLDNAERILKAVCDYCFSRGISFKFLHSKKILLARNAKYTPREDSGKFVTIYPADYAELERVLVDLTGELADEPGPYILSDLRYGAGPLYVRYGAFTERWLATDRGRLVPAIERPNGTLIPEQRTPVFSVPDWAELPDVLVPHLALRELPHESRFPHLVEHALHFTNGGGVYLAKRDMGDELVVLKEARPYAGLDADGTDAVARLHRERNSLERLQGVTGVPILHDWFTAWEHHYLMMEYLPGRRLDRWLAAQYPLTMCDSEQADLAAYTRRALGVLDQVEKLIRSIHERGIVFADLHPGNILIAEDDTVSLVDFELAFAIDESDGRPVLAAPGFSAPDERTGPAIDNYALAALRLHMFLPLTHMMRFQPDKVNLYMEAIQERFPVPDEFGKVVLAELAPTSGSVVGVPSQTTSRARVNAGRRKAPTVSEFDSAQPDWHAICGSLIDAILLSATPDRQDRLFPGDIEQFTAGGTCFAFGAAGVLHALSTSGGGRYVEHERWLLESVRRDPPRRPGFYDGTHGIAYVLRDFGYVHEAVALIEESAPLVGPLRDHGLHSGLAGVGLNLLHFGQVMQSGTYLAQAMSIGDRLTEKLTVVAGRLDGREPRATAGLLHGWSGPGLFFVRLYEHTSDPSWLDMAACALQLDLDECVARPDGSLQVPSQDGRALPHLDVGTAGIALVVQELVRHVPDTECAIALPAMRRACCPEFVVQSGLFAGRAGLLGALAMLQRGYAGLDGERALTRHLVRLGWHAVPYRGELAFPGNKLLRLSMDFATGTAGVLRALTVAVDRSGALLPFLDDGDSTK